MKARRMYFYLMMLVGVLIVLPESGRATTVIYYDHSEDGANITLANMVYNLAGHFDADLTVREIDAYQAGDLSAFERAIYLGMVFRQLPPAFLAAVASGERPILWIGGGIEQLTALPGMSTKLGFRYQGYTLGLGFDRIEYKNQQLIREQLFDFYQMEVTGNAEILAAVANRDSPTVTYPYFLHGAHVWYWADIPFFNQLFDDRYFVFADALHEFFGTTGPHRHTALLRLEDLAPGATHLVQLRVLSEALAAEEIPFAFDLTPFFVDPRGEIFPPGTVKRFADDPKLVTRVNVMLQQGGTMIMHGVTHQHDDGLSLNDWEFVLDVGNQPLPCDSAQWARNRVETGLAEFAAQGWRPLVWETPHYAASHGDYRVFAEYFAIDFERPLIFPLPPDAAPIFGVHLSPASQAFPYASPIGSNGMGHLPENLGYINPQTPGQKPEDLIEKARRLSIVRDATAGFYIHNGLVRPADLWQVIDGLRDLGYEFVSIAELIGDDDDNDDDTATDDDNDDNDNDDDDDDDDDNDDDNNDDSQAPSPTHGDDADEDNDDNSSSGCI